jgi:hypothetical protein
MLAAVIVLACLLCVALCLLAFLGLRMRNQRSAQLHDRFGSEYDRSVEEHGGRHAAAERDLVDRSRRHDKLHIRELNDPQRDAFATSWRDVQARFVDQPREAVADADSLVRDVMSERGYPVTDFEQRSADLSVEHADVVENYRAAHAIRSRDAQGQATTEELRNAMVHYRALFDSLLARPTAGARGGRP